MEVYVEVIFGCSNVHVQTCSSSVTSKRCQEDSLNLPMSFPTKQKQGITFGLRLLLSALNPSKVLLSFNSDSYANETTIQPLKEKSTP